MAKKLFILGRPGSGKSAAFRHIKQYINRKYGWSAIHYNDYDILKDLFLFEKLFQSGAKSRRFRATEHGGFDVLDFSVLDIALKRLEKEVRHRYSSNDELIVIEFARDDYAKALELFSPGFLKDAFFLFLDTDLRTCMKRVQERVTHPTSEDDHFVSEDILRSYYNIQTLPHSFDKGKIKVITNKGLFQEFIDKLDRFADNILLNELVVENYSKTSLRGAFHLSLFTPKALTSWFSPTHTKVE